MAVSFTALKDRARSPGGKKAIKYTIVSVIAVCVTQLALAIIYGALHWTARSSALAASSIGAVPSYYLNRYWAWGKRGRSHLTKEVLPFWILTFVGMAFSMWSAAFAESFAKDRYDSRLVQTLCVNAGVFGAFGLLWVAKFMIFNKVLFKAHPQELEDAPALDGRTGIPT